MSRTETDCNPPFNQARGAAIATAPPPFDFQNVILRVFPLRADIHALRLFCDRYLNIAPEFALFEPAAPYVFLETINYGKMSTVASNFGWVSQNEVAFAVLLNWYRIEDGRPVFHATASVCPFIFVDEETSVRGGREVFGWPKSLAWLTPGIDAWARDPRSPRTLFTLSAMVFPELFAGQRQQPRVLFEIEQDPPPSAAEFPLDPWNPLNPMVALPRALLNSMQMAGNLMENVARLPIQGFPLGGKPGGERPRGVAGSDFRTASIPNVLGETFGGLNPFAQLPAFNTINLKQFRDSARPEEVCYQALVNAKMTAKSVKRGGLLGQQGLALGDPSGGYTLKFHRYKAWPIIESLGLDVASETSESGRPVATLKPVLPNWIETDFHYGRGEVLCWRSRYTGWAPAPKAGAPARSANTDAVLCPEPHPFNTAEGGALDQVRGPFHFPNVTLRVLPLLAEERKLQAFCDAYLNHRVTEFDHVEGSSWKLAAEEPETGLPRNMFRAWGRYVYLITTNFEEMSSELNVGWWARRQVSFAFPVKWYRYSSKKGEWFLMSSAMVAPYIYADSSVAATTGREMQGRPVVKAQIESPPSAWLNEAGPARPEELLRLTTGVYPAINVGQRMEDRLLLEITGRDVLDVHDEEGWSELSSSWGERLVDELRRKVGRSGGQRSIKALALELLAGRRPLNHISLKQFRDAEHPDEACYQAVTLSPETFERVYDLREIDERLHVAIHRYPSQAIVETLGLEVKRTDAEHENVIDYLQPIRPFWMRASIQAHLGEDIFWRAGSPTWRASDPRWIAEPQTVSVASGKEPAADPAPLFFERVEPAPFADWTAKWIESDPENKRRLQDLGSRVTTDKVEELRRRRRPEKAKAEQAREPLSPRLEGWRTIRQRLRKIERSEVSPQDGVESILSREWLHFGVPRWEQRRQVKEAEPDKRMTEASIRRRWELICQLEARGIGRREVDEELEERLPGALPLKKDFIIRRDTVGHPTIRARFEADHGLDRLDDDFWYWTPEERKGRRSFVREFMRDEWWAELEMSWIAELDDLRSRLLVSEAVSAALVLDEVETLTAKLRDRMAGARDSGDYKGVYRRVQDQIRNLRAKVEESGLIAHEPLVVDQLDAFREQVQATARATPEPASEATEPKPEPPSAPKKKAKKKAAKQKTKKKVEKKAKKGRAGSPEGVPLEPGMIAGLNEARIRALNGAGVLTVQDLVEAKDLQGSLPGATTADVARIVKKGRKLLDPKG